MLTGLVQALLKSSGGGPSQFRGGAGAAPVGYNWHRQQAIANLGDNGVVKRAQWLKEVRTIYQNQQGVTWREALRKASDDRKKTSTDYKTVKGRVISSYKGRDASTVKCKGIVCPGKYNKAPSEQYRPQAHPNKRVLTQAAAVDLLKTYYRQRGNLTGKLIEAERAMKSNISRKRNNVVNPCSVKPVSYTTSTGVATVRNVAVKDPACADNWLYRSKARSYDMAGVNHGNKKDSPAYGASLTKR
jgi:hypothetical protein